MSKRSARKRRRSKGTDSPVVVADQHPWTERERRPRSSRVTAGLGCAVVLTCLVALLGFALLAYVGFGSAIPATDTPMTSAECGVVIGEFGCASLVPPGPTTDSDWKAAFDTSVRVLGVIVLILGLFSAVLWAGALYAWRRSRRARRGPAATS